MNWQILTNWGMWDLSPHESVQAIAVILVLLGLILVQQWMSFKILSRLKEARETLSKVTAFLEQKR